MIALTHIWRWFCDHIKKVLKKKKARKKYSHYHIAVNITVIHNHFHERETMQYIEGNFVD